MLLEIGLGSMIEKPTNHGYWYLSQDHRVTVFDRSRYDQNGDVPEDKNIQAASVDHNKIVSTSFR